MSEKIQSPNSGFYETHQSGLEAHYIEDFLNSKGLSRSELGQLPPDEARQLMREASRYASTKLAEHEARAKFTKDIRYD